MDSNICLVAESLTPPAEPIRGIPDETAWLDAPSAGDALGAGVDEGRTSDAPGTSAGLDTDGAGGFTVTRFSTVAGWSAEFVESTAEPDVAAELDESLESRPALSLLGTV